MDAYERLAKAGARVAYFCAYCGYVFDGPPKLPVKCPQCGRELTNFSKPVVEPAKLCNAPEEIDRKRWGQRF